MEMSSHVAGVPLSAFEEPISVALRGYAELAEDHVTFDVAAAARLALTPDKPNTARSVTTVRHFGEAAGVKTLILPRP